MSGKQKSQQFVKNTQAFALGQSVLVVLAGEAFSGYRAEGRAASVAAIGRIVLIAVRHHRPTLIENMELTTRFPQINAPLIFGLPLPN